MGTIKIMTDIVSKTHKSLIKLLQYMKAEGKTLDIEHPDAMIYGNLIDICNELTEYRYGHVAQPAEAIDSNPIQ